LPMDYNTMWCRRCQQEVPGIVCHDDAVGHDSGQSHETGRYRCPRCGEPLGDRTRHGRQQTPAVDHVAQRAGDAVMAAMEPAADPSSRPAVIPLPQMASRPMLDHWEADEQLRHIGRVLAVEELAVARPEILRIDGAHLHGPAGQHRHAAPQRPRKHRHAKAKSQPAARTGGLLPYLTWFCTLLGTMATTCGGVLLGWSAWTEQADAGRMGVPIELGGLAVLAVGMLLQLDQTWHDRRAAARLRSRRTGAAACR
jgi:hypothetical protein